MGVRENLEGPLTDCLHEWVRCAFELNGPIPAVPTASAWPGEFRHWHLLQDRRQGVSAAALGEALAGVRLLSNEARLAVTPFLMLEPFVDSPDYGAPAEQFLFLGDDLDWLRIYSPLQLSCIAFYALLPASLGDFSRAELWHEEWWNLPLLVHCGSTPLAIGRILNV
jgi:hypothetical protein